MTVYSQSNNNIYFINRKIRVGGEGGRNNTCKVLTKVNEESPIALALILWKNHDAGHIILLLTMFLLGMKTA